MPRPTTRNSDDSDDDNALEAEYDKLQLNYKISEQQRLQYSIEVQKKIRLQNQLIKNLEAEKEDLNKNLNLAQSKTNEIKDEAKTVVLGQLLESKDRREKEIQDEKELEEMTGTGAVAGYNTPAAFSKPGQTAKKNNRLAKISGGEIVDDLEEGAILNIKQEKDKQIIGDAMN